MSHDVAVLAFSVFALLVSIVSAIYSCRVCHQLELAADQAEAAADEAEASLRRAEAAVAQIQAVRALKRSTERSPS